jgi:hypothetical protein
LSYEVCIISQPINLSAASDISGEVALSWDVDSGVQDKELSAMSFVIYSRTVQAADFSLLATVPCLARHNSYAVTGLVSGQTYEFKIKAVTSKKDSGFPPSIQVTVK